MTFIADELPEEPAATGATVPRTGSLFGTRTPDFDYVPGTAKRPTFPALA
ncbi:hypothetical protein [Streptomyces sp. NPDC060035]